MKAIHSQTTETNSYKPIDLIYIFKKVSVLVQIASTLLQHARITTFAYM